MNELPEGFVLDNNDSGLPEGFSVDVTLPPAKQPKLKIPSTLNKPADSTWFGVSGLGRFAQGLADPSIAGAQIVARGMEAAGIPYGTRVLDYYRDYYENYGKAREDAGQSGIDVPRLAGTLLSPQSIAIGSGVTAAAPTLAGKVGAGMVGGELFGAFTPVEGDGSFDKEKALQVGSGGVIGGAFPLVGQAVKSSLTPAASRDKELKALLDAGVKPTIGEALGGRWAKNEEMLTSLPFLGDMIAVAKNNSVKSVERAAHNKALGYVGEKLPDDLLGRDAVNYTRSLLSNRYEALLNKIGAVPVDQKFAANTAKLSGMVDDLRIPDSEKQVFRMALDDVAAGVDNNGYMTSEGYKLAESNLSQIIKSLAASKQTNAYAGKMETAVQEVKNQLKEMLYRHAGNDAKELAKTDAAWKAYKVIEKAADAAGAEGGSFTPAGLAAAVKSSEKSISKRAGGKAMLQDLSDPAKARIGNKVPNSFTADRAARMGAALAAGQLNPLIPASLIGGGALYTQPVQNALVRAVTSQPGPIRQALINAPIPSQALPITNQLILRSNLGNGE